ncbi:hypothetical protein AHAS_Ahas09G0270200 [Arachis hypogaea]
MILLILLGNNLETTSAICCACEDPPEDPVVTMRGHVFCYQCVSDYLNGDGNTCSAPGCKAALAEDAVFSKATLKSCLCDELCGSNSIKVHDFAHSLVQQSNCYADVAESRKSWKRRKMVASTFGDDNSDSRLSVDDLKYLFGVDS